MFSVQLSCFLVYWVMPLFVRRSKISSLYVSEECLCSAKSREMMRLTVILRLWLWTTTKYLICGHKERGILLFGHHKTVIIKEAT